VNEALRAQAEQAISAAEQLLDFDEPSPVDSLAGQMSALDVRSSSANHASPATPNRLAPSTPANGRTGYDLLRTPVNVGNGARAIWEDSPKNQAMTPKFLEKLKGRRYEQGWWARQQQCEYSMAIQLWWGPVEQL
jgi:CLIP-associating protein 1/2